MLLLWAHAHLPIIFSLVVNNFCVKYTVDAAAHHLIAALRSLYTISVDWYISLFCGLTLAWDYAIHTVDVSMTGYIDEALHKIQNNHSKYDKTPPTPGRISSMAPKSSTRKILTTPLRFHQRPSALYIIF